MKDSRGLGVVDASLIVVGSIVGAGIFLVSGIVASLVHSPAAFLATWVPQILSSPAYKKDGMLLILFTTPGPAAASSPKTSKAVRTGALVLSKYATTGTTVKTTYNPYSVLVSIEDLFDFTPLAHAKGANSFLSAALSGS